MAGRILIADDLATNRIMLKVKLSAASYRVLQATSQKELLHKARAQRPDLIIIASAFAGDRAIDCCHEIRQGAETADIPVVILASGYSPADRLAALNAGACEILEQGLDSALLLARLRNILRCKSVRDELRLRTQTALELGFRENPGGFRHRGRLLMVGPARARIEEMPAEMRSKLKCDLISSSGTETLGMISDTGRAPDIVILPDRLEDGRDSLFLLAELRSRASTRHSAIVMLARPGDTDASIAALDMGATDVVDSKMSDAEMIFRLGRHLRSKREADLLREALDDGLRMAVTDPLTGLYNRRYALPHLARVAERAAHTGRPFAVMVLDLDHFKRVNDTHGHAAGDTVLREVAARLRSNIRGVDLIARIGGEEFLVVMPETDLGQARIAAERLRRVIGGSPIAIAQGGAETAVHVTASIGVSIGSSFGGTQSSPSEIVSSMVARADQALLGAKSTGRNQVIFERSAAA